MKKTKPQEKKPEGKQLPKHVKAVVAPLPAMRKPSATEVHALIKARPGMTGEEIRVALNSGSLEYPLWFLKSRGYVEGRGTTRSMTYKATRKKFDLDRSGVAGTFGPPAAEALEKLKNAKRK